MSDDYEPSPLDWVAAHVQSYEASDGAVGSEYHGVPCVILTTRGRTTGRVRKTPVVRIRNEAGYVAIASMGGQPQHPSWYLNLVAHPDVTLQDGEEVGPFVARPVEGAERAELWELATRVHADFDEYQTRCERQIPVVAIEPRSAPGR